ncbi:MAG: VWA domain-containing protein [Chitinivibrionales bacterium]|nr:VWA domain-containing protein [Chitinivibrionales bacterium]
MKHSSTPGNPHVTLRLAIIFAFTSTLVLAAKEAGKFTFTEDIFNFTNPIIQVPFSSVALSDVLTIKPHPFILIPPRKRSIVFCIDNSGSMKNGVNEGAVITDQWGERFQFCRDFLDTICRQSPKTEVGVVVFGSHLFFDPADNALFRTLPPPHDTGAYLPLLTLDSLYTPPGKTGYAIIRELLISDTVNFHDPANRAQRYVDLVYVPSNPLYAADSSNIDCAFQAVKGCIASALTAKEHHFLIFLSDGEANYPPSNCTQFINGAAIPTTFTRCYSLSPSIPQTLMIMTNNIQKNNYSPINPITNLFTMKQPSDSIQTAIAKLIFNDITTWRLCTPVQCIINGSAMVELTKDGAFRYEQPFALTCAMTPFSFRISYSFLPGSQSSNGTCVGSQWDTTVTWNFFASIGDSSIPKEVTIQRWNRAIGFFFDSLPVNRISSAAKNVRIRFTESKIDVLYGYTTASVEVRTTAGLKQDVEYVNLEKKDSIFESPIALQTAEAVASDGILQLQPSDSIVVTFRNGKLPLDTLRAAIAYESSISISKKLPAFYAYPQCAITVAVFSSLGRKVFEYSPTENGRAVAAVSFFYKGNLHFLHQPFAAGAYLVRLTIKNPTDHRIMAQEVKTIVHHNR